MLRPNLIKRVLTSHLLLHRPDAGIEICKTYQYGQSPEASISATRDWIVGEKVLNCMGITAVLSPDDVLNLGTCRMSVLHSTFSNRPIFLVGPAALVNSDHSPNCKLERLDNLGNSIILLITRDVAAGEQLFINYNDSTNEYFLKDLCLCVTCETVSVSGRPPNFHAAIKPTYLACTICDEMTDSSLSIKPDMDAPKRSVCHRCCRHYQTYHCIWPIRLATDDNDAWQNNIISASKNIINQLKSIEKIVTHKKSRSESRSDFTINRAEKDLQTIGRTVVGLRQLLNNPTRESTSDHTVGMEIPKIIDRQCKRKDNGSESIYFEIPSIRTRSRTGNVSLTVQDRNAHANNLYQLEQEKITAKRVRKMMDNTTLGSSLIAIIRDMTDHILPLHFLEMFESYKADFPQLIYLQSSANVSQFIKQSEKQSRIQSSIRIESFLRWLEVKENEADNQFTSEQWMKTFTGNTENPHYDILHSNWLIVGDPSSTMSEKKEAQSRMLHHEAPYLESLEKTSTGLRLLNEVNIRIDLDVSIANSTPEGEAIQDMHNALNLTRRVPASRTSWNTYAKELLLLVNASNTIKVLFSNHWTRQVYRDVSSIRRLTDECMNYRTGVFGGWSLVLQEDGTRSAFHFDR
jgi:hypothetical protein